MPPTLTTLEAEPPAVGAIEMLQGLIKRIRAREISSIAVAFVLRDGSGEHDWSYMPSPMALIGSVSVLHYALVKSEHEAGVEEGATAA